MDNVLDCLHSFVMNSYKNGQKIILSGHSAGGFITYEYLMSRLKFINLSEFGIFNAKKTKYTCLDAMVKSGAFYQLSNDKIVLNCENYKNNLKELDNMTELYCIPENTILGVMNFGSSNSLFYPENYFKNIQQRKFIEYLQSKNIFFISVNFADDPLSLPDENNYSKNELEQKYNLNFSSDGQGFIYNYMCVNSPATFLGAHLSYWKHSNKFAKMLRDGYILGKKNFYDE